MLKYAFLSVEYIPKHPFTVDRRAASAEQLGVQWLVQSHLEDIKGSRGALLTDILPTLSQLA